MAFGIGPALTTFSGHPAGWAAPSHPAGTDAPDATCKRQTLEPPDTFPNIGTTRLRLASKPAVRLLAKELADHLATIDNLERPADGGLDLLGRVNLERVAERSHQVGNGDGPVLDLGAVSVRGADHLSAPDAAAGKGHIEHLRVMIAAGAGVDLRGPAKLAHPDDQGAPEHAVLLQIADQGRKGRIDVLGQGRHPFVVLLVGVP